MRVAVSGGFPRSRLSWLGKSPMYLLQLQRTPLNREKSDHVDPHRFHRRDGSDYGWTGGKPGAAWGNITGITNMAAILTGKRLQLLKETIPTVSRIAVLWDPQAPGSVPQWEETQLLARELGLQPYSMEVSSVDKYETAFKEAVAAGNTALWVTLNPLANSNQKKIANLAIDNRLPSICARSDYSENGCMMAYGPGYGNEGKDGARYVDRILKGAKPPDIPVEQPVQFEFVINLKTAKALSLEIPPMVLARADDVIE